MAAFPVRSAHQSAGRRPGDECEFVGRWVCPLAGRGKVEFPVFLYVDRSNEGFAAGMQPEVIFCRCWLFAGEQDVAGIAVKVVIHRQVSIFDQANTGFDRADCCTGGRWVALQ